mmetsp:Transcript_27440/g.38615  ORF Transcript_27440/g.38615 Transcript_27440/m.38615 type:complete len:276 (+) Transcript_27440:147-974(+)
MGFDWNDAWDDILNRNRPPQWKVDVIKAKSNALNHIETYYYNINNKGGATSSRSSSPTPSVTLSSASSSSSSSSSLLSSPGLRIFCPLAGDDPFVKYAWDQGHDVTALDLVPAAIEAMKSQFDGTWEKQEQSHDNDAGDSTGTIIWTHESGRATLYQGDIFIERKELFNKFHAIYDKDSFGALEKSMRPTYCDLIAKYVDVDSGAGIVYIEAKIKANDHPERFTGPAYHVDHDDLMESSSFGKNFEYVISVGKVYEIPLPKMIETGHVLKRVVRQ